MKPRHYLIITLSCITVLLFGIAGFIYAVDPSQMYHRHDTYLGNQRYEIAGVARHHDYNAAIIGSSMSMNHFPEQVDSLWGWKTKNFSLMGATHDEYDVLLPYLIRQGKVKNIIFGIDFFSFNSELGAIPKYMYDDNPWNDISYLLSYNGLKNAIKYINHQAPERNLYHFNSPIGRKYVFEGFAKQKDANPKIYDFATMARNFDSHVLPHIARSAKEVRWIIYFPPYSIGEFSLLLHWGQLEDALKFKKHIAMQLSRLPNVELYDFQREELMTNHDDFMDLRHHSLYTNRRLMKWIKKDEYRLDTDALDKANRNLVSLAYQYLDSLSQLTSLRAIKSN